MLIFAKDIYERNPRVQREADHPELAKYMEYQRQLFPYTIVRAGLDLAYKELDDILNYVENDHQKPEGSQRDSYPADVPAWYRDRFPWSASFLSMEDMHSLMVTLIQSLDSFRTFERGTTYQWVILYDATHNIVRVYNDLLKTNPNGARDIRLSREVEVDFDDFINTYWPHLEFMILSKPDYPHRRLMERNHEIEEAIKAQLADGASPLKALEDAAKQYSFAPGTLPLLRRDPVTPDVAILEEVPIESNPYNPIQEPTPPDAPIPNVPWVEAEYELNFLSNRGMATKE
ncbi:hypothetical protein ACTRW9_09950 [Nitrospina sp. 32_T5]|uniref:hypothetical protein n=1 Tax=unclassified Nitrospina TaxID=2638683 RepID=UPI003F9A0E0B